MQLDYESSPRTFFFPTKIRVLSVHNFQGTLEMSVRIDIFKGELTVACLEHLV